ncbi:MAG: hypothetical protein Ta2E_11500 [Mycoplasmoidaceae bacterium]|nr:MAG: hypothetical protein Ta2E_11500 [Mycoplasmoidaceae bacterium]
MIGYSFCDGEGRLASLFKWLLQCNAYKNEEIEQRRVEDDAAIRIGD